MNANALIEQLNGGTAQSRLDALAKLVAAHKSGELPMPETTQNVNNHIHTIYSFSPYSPTKAAYMAWISGLTTAGIMDHDSIAGAKEFIRAGEIIGIEITCGFECRVSMANTDFSSVRLNNPDQKGVAYVAMHGIPHQNIDKVQEFMTPYRAKRNIRNRKMIDNINTLLAPYDVVVDFDTDVLPLSMDCEGGSVTERHLLFAVAKKLTARFGKGPQVVDFLKNDMKISVSEKIEGYLSDKDNPHYEYDLLGALKSNMVEKFYIDAKEECPDVAEFIKLGKEVGGVTAYAYLGDVGNSVTGDKKAQKFEDDYIYELVKALKDLGFNAITYMPTRNTKEQLTLLIKLCNQYGFYEISGEDINSPRQSFLCEALNLDYVKHLITATWALIGHEKAATKDITASMFSDKTIAKYPDLRERIDAYAEIGKN